LAAELTDALAQIIHQRIAAELGGACPGVRYGFGYPACPNLELNAPLLELLRAEDIGLTVSESYMLVPEYSTTGLLAYHPAARYFSV
ncbi:MAG: hypothetical protein LBC67_04220, partial [Spirochaetales bacterium]|nr:hypothetical protein [Spirochaetales bacterium]